MGLPFGLIVFSSHTKYLTVKIVPKQQSQTFNFLVEYEVNTHKWTSIFDMKDSKYPRKAYINSLLEICYLSSHKFEQVSSK